MKRCRTCGVPKTFDAFHRNSTSPDGRRPDCKDCTKEKDAARYELKKEKKKLQAFMWYINNPVQAKETRKTYYERCKDELKEHNREWAKENRHRIREAQRRWRANNLAKVRESNRRYAKANPEKFRVKSIKRRALKAGAEGSFTGEEFKSLCEFYDNKCLCCGEVKPLTVDHVIPLSKGGSNSIDNIQPLCGSCNSSKGTKIVDYRKGK